MTLILAILALVQSFKGHFLLAAVIAFLMSATKGRL